MVCGEEDDRGAVSGHGLCQFCVGRASPIGEFSGFAVEEESPFRAHQVIGGQMGGHGGGIVGSGEEALVEIHAPVGVHGLHL